MTTSIFLESNKQLSKPIVPRKAPFHNPAPRDEFRISAFQFDFLTSLHDMRDIASFDTLVDCRLASVSFICAKMLPSSHLSPWALDNRIIQGIRQQLCVVFLSSADDEGQRDTTAVDENASFAPIFFPDPLGCDRPLQEQAVLYSSRRRCFATARQYPPFHHIRQGQPSITVRKIRLSAIRENIGESRLGCQNVPWALPSIEYRFAAHKQSRRRLSAVGLVFFLLRGLEGIFAVFPFVSWGSGAQPSPKIHLISPMKVVVFPWKKYN